MQEGLRNELHNLWMEKHEGKITKEQYKKQIKDLIHGLLEENPQVLLDLCDGHIGGLPDENLLEMAKNETEDFVYMNISAGSYCYSTMEDSPKHPKKKEILEIYRNLLKILGISEAEIKELLKKAKTYDYYNSDPAGAILELLMDEDICVAIDWKFGPDDVEYNLNLIAEKLQFEPIPEYPPYEEGQPLGLEAIEEVIRESQHSGVAICDGDTFYVFMTSEEKVELVLQTLHQLDEFWELDSAFIL